MSRVAHLCGVSIDLIILLLFLLLTGLLYHRRSLVKDQFKRFVKSGVQSRLQLLWHIARDLLLPARRPRRHGMAQKALLCLDNCCPFFFDRILFLSHRPRLPLCFQCTVHDLHFLLRLVDEAAAFL